MDDYRITIHLFVKKLYTRILSFNFLFLFFFFYIIRSIFKRIST